MDLTKEEKNAIQALKRVAKKMAKVLMAFFGIWKLVRYENGPNNEPTMTSGGGVDQQYIVNKIDIRNDGGDW